LLTKLDARVNVPGMLLHGLWLPKTFGAAVVTQLRTAYEHYSKDGTVLALVVMTTADKMSGDPSDASEALSKELKVPVHVVLRKEMMKVLSDGLMASPSRPGAAEGMEDG
jgi:hypothetical protein